MQAEKEGEPLAVFQVVVGYDPAGCRTRPDYYNGNDVVIGFRIQTPDSADEQLRRLEAYVTVAMETVPQLGPWRKQFKRRKVGDGQYLILTVDGTRIPDAPAA